MNPLLEDWTTPFGLPPFAAIETGHFAPAFEAALAEARANIDAIAADPARAELRQHDRGDGAGRARARPGGGGVLQPRRAPTPTTRSRRCSASSARGWRRTSAETMMNAALFARVDDAGGAAGGARADGGAGPGARRSTTGCSCGPGARLEGAERERLKAILQRLASLGDRLRAERAGRRAGLGAGARARGPRRACPAELVAAAAQAAAEPRAGTGTS